MASKLLVVKVGGLKKKSALWPKCVQAHLAQVVLRAGSNHNSNFVAL